MPTMLPEVLLRRTDLVLTRWSKGRVGLERDDGDKLRTAGVLDRDEWQWVRVCAAPLALDVLGREPAASPFGEQTVLEVG